MTESSKPTRTTKSAPKSAPAPKPEDDETAKPDAGLEEAVRIIGALRETLDLLTGHEELAITEVFGHDVWDVYDDVMSAAGGTKSTMRLARMIAFVDRMRDGLPPKVAFDSAMSLTSKEADLILAQNSGDESGKDESGATS